MESPHHPSTAHASFKLSWTAYVRPSIVFIVMLMIGIALIGASAWFGALFLTFATGLFLFRILSLRTLLLYTDDHGVWVYSGILPWSKGISGVKWRDLEDAGYFPNFLSWLFKSYTVHVGHRFTKASEIILSHVAHGHNAVSHINQRHRQALASRVDNLT